MHAFQQMMQTLPALSAYARRIDLPKVNLNLFLYESGQVGEPAVILVHGLGDEADTWRLVIPALVPQRRVIAFDLPGFGRSDKPRRSYTVEFFRDVLLELMGVLDISHATLAGHSLGALIIHSTALNAPERVERLVLVDGSLASRTQKLDLKTAAFLIPGLGEWMYNRLRRDPQAAYRSLAPYYNSLEALPAEERAFLYHRVNERVWSDAQRRAFLSTLRNLARWLPAQQRVLLERLAGLAVPTLAIWGDQDKLQNPDNGRYLVEIQPSARLVIIPGAGHNLQQEHPQPIVEAILGDLPV